MFINVVFDTSRIPFFLWIRTSHTRQSRPKGLLPINLTRDYFVLLEGSDDSTSHPSGLPSSLPSFVLSDTDDPLPVTELSLLCVPLTPPSTFLFALGPVLPNYPKEDSPLEGTGTLESGPLTPR